ncbi:MAG TPA: TraR/DksA C4-type zinc finger protein [Candidatus Paceibacterota bacterium]|nr:TraR/DksA C4-type zinc finger protein [Candidatus Paceibacterota bacterium]
MGKKEETLNLLSSFQTPTPAERKPDDQVFHAHEEEYRLSMRRLYAQNLQAIKAALARLDQGKFGTCVDCGDAISDRRLESMPWAIRCCDCTKQQEDRPRLRVPVGSYVTT